jgi:hypothetical protein
MPPRNRGVWWSPSSDSSADVPFRSTEVNANLTKGAADAGDLLQLLRLWDPSRETSADFQARAVEENLLGKPTRGRMSDFIKQVLARRYMPAGDDAPARHVARLSEAGVEREVLLKVLYYHAALAERLLYLVATELLYDAVRSGARSIRALDVGHFIHRLAAQDRAPTYSAGVIEKLAQSALTALRDFGIVEGKVRKRILAVRVPNEVIGYLVHALRDEGASARNIVQHPDWRLFLLDSGEVERAILEGAHHGHYTYSAAGDIRRFDFHHDSLADYVESLCRDHAAAATY